MSSFETGTSMESPQDERLQEAFWGAGSGRLPEEVKKVRDEYPNEFYDAVEELVREQDEPTNDVTYIKKVSIQHSAELSDDLKQRDTVWQWTDGGLERLTRILEERGIPPQYSNEDQA